MNLRLQVIGLNKLLNQIYGHKTSLSILLKRSGFSLEDIQTLRQQYLVQIVTTHIEEFREYLYKHEEGERLYEIMNRLLGLDGNTPESLEELGKRLNITHTQLKQIENQTLDLCKRENWIHLWEGNLINASLGFLNEHHKQKLHDLQINLTIQEREIEQLKDQLLKANSEIREAERNSDLALGKSGALRSENEQLKKEIKKSRQSQIDLDEYFANRLLDIAKDSAQRGQKFLVLLKKLKVNPFLPIEIAKELELELRKLLNLYEPSQGLAELISQAQTRELLTKEAIHLAHIIRRQRNIVAHKQTKQESLIARTLLSLFSASLLWHELPE